MKSKKEQEKSSTKEKEFRNSEDKVLTRKKSKDLQEALEKVKKDMEIAVR